MLNPKVTPLPLSFGDVEGLLEAISSRGLMLDAVLPYGSDQSVLPAAQIAERLGLRGIGSDVAFACTDKIEMRRRWAEAGLPLVPYATATTAAGAVDAALDLGLPVVVKPPDNAAQRGVQRVDDEELLLAAAEEALAQSPSGRVLVEQYIDGPEVAVTTFASRGDTIAIQVTDRVTAPAPYLGVCLAHVYPTALNPSDVAIVEQTVVRAAESLGVFDGPTYSQVRLREGEAYVLETGARLGGGRDCELRSLLCGQDAIGAHLRLLLDGDIDHQALLDPEAITGAGCVEFLISPPGRLRGVSGVEALEQAAGLRSWALFFEEGDLIPELRSGASRAGYLIATGATRSEALERAARASELLLFDVEQGYTQLSSHR